MTNYYTLLAVDPTADAATITAALKLRKKRVSHLAAQGATLEVRQDAERVRPLLLEAEDILLDPDKRGAYDEQLRHAPPVEAGKPDDTAYILAILEEGYGYLRNKQWQHALECGMRVTGEDGNCARGWLLLASAHDALGDTQDALYECERAIRSAPADPALPYFKGGLLLGLDRCGEAAQCFQKAQSLAPSNVDYVAAEGIAYRAQGEISSAVGTFERCLELDRTNACANQMLGLCLLEDVWPQGWYTAEVGSGVAPGLYPSCTAAMQSAEQALLRTGDLELPSEVQQLRRSRMQLLARMRERVYDGSWGTLLLACVLTLLAFRNQDWWTAIFWFGAGSVAYYRAARVPRWIKVRKKLESNDVLSNLPPIWRALLVLLSALFVPLSAAALYWQNRRAMSGG